MMWFLFLVLTALKLWGEILIHPGEIGIVVSKVGREVGKEMIVVEEGFKGIRRRLLHEGLYWYFPITHKVHVIGSNRKISNHDFLLKVNQFKRNSFSFTCSNQKCHKIIRLEVSQLKHQINCFHCQQNIDITPQLQNNFKNFKYTPYYQPVTNENELRNLGYTNLRGKFGVLGTLKIKQGEFGIVKCRQNWPGTKNTLDLGPIVSKGARGIWKEPIFPGTYRFHPIIYEISIYPALKIPLGFGGVVIRKQGKELPAGHLLAKEGEKGPLEEVLISGIHYLNPIEFEVEIVPKISIEHGHAGVQISRVGRIQPRKPGEKFSLVEKGERGVMRKVLSPGSYFINPYARRVISVDMREQFYVMDGANALKFPAHGIWVEAVLAIEWQVDPTRLPEVIAIIGGPTEIVEKIIRPMARSIGQIEGSQFSAESLLLGKSGKIFQKTFKKRMKEYGEKKGILIHQVQLRGIKAPRNVMNALIEKELERQRKKKEGKK